MAHDVFISHSSDDRAVADELCSHLEEVGVQCWIAPRDVRLGKDWGSEIIRGLENAKVMVVILSANSNASQSVTNEVERASSKCITIIPVRIEEVRPSKALEFFLSSKQSFDAITPPREPHIERLARTVMEYVVLPQEVVEGLTAESALTRIGAAWHLGRLAQDTDTQRAAVAKRRILERLHSDESERDHLVRIALEEALPFEVPGFSAENSDLTGVWKGNDDCTYYIRQLENEIWWYGQGTSDWQAFANVAYGTINENGVVQLRWSDLPKKHKDKIITTSAGELVLKCNYSIQRGYVTDLTALSMTGQFGGSSWTRTRSQ